MLLLTTFCGIASFTELCNTALPSLTLKKKGMNMSMQYGVYDGIDGIEWHETEEAAIEDVNERLEY